MLSVRLLPVYEKLTRLFEPFGRSDLVESLADLQADQVVGGQQMLVNRREIGGAIRRDERQGPSRQDAKPIVDVVHVWSAIDLVISQETSVVEAHVAAIPLVIVAEDGHEAGAAALAKCPFHWVEIAREHRVPVEDDERLSEHWQCALQGAGGAEQRLTIEDVLDRHAPAAAVPQR